MTVAANGIAFDREGPRGGTPLVLLHAGVADRRMWDSAWSALTAERDCLRLDLRGFGESSVPPSGTLDHVGDVRGVLESDGVSDCHLVGASFGAGVAVEVALTAPSLVSSLLLCPPGGSLLAEMTPDLRAFAVAENEALERGDLGAAVEANVSTWLVGPGRSADAVSPLLVSQVRGMQRRAFEIQLAWGDLDEVELDPPALDRLGSVSCPTLVLVGGHDLLTTHDAVRRASEGIRSVRRVDWPAAAHLPTMEDPDGFVSLLLEWTS